MPSAPGRELDGDPRDPTDRIRRMQSSCGITKIIGDQQLLHKLHREYEKSECPSPFFIDLLAINSLSTVDSSLIAASSGILDHFTADRSQPAFDNGSTIEHG